MLARREPDLARALADPQVQGIDLKIGDAKRSHAALRRISIAWQCNQHDARALADMTVSSCPERGRGGPSAGT